MLTALDLYHLALACREDEGGTIDPFTGELLDLKESAFHEDDYFVSVSGHEEACRAEKLLADITEWVNTGACEEARRRGLYVGLWWETPDYLVVDLTTVANGVEEAHALAQAHGQRAVLHIGSGLCLATEQLAVAA